MPGSLNYSPSGSEGGGSFGGGGADLERSLIGVDLTTTPGTTPLKWRQRSTSGSSGGNFVPGEGSCTPANKGQERVPPRIATRKPSWDAAKGTDAPPAQTLDDPVRLLRKPLSGQSTPRRTSYSSSSPTTARVAGLATVDQEDDHGRVRAGGHSEPAPRLGAGGAVSDKQHQKEGEPDAHILDPSAALALDQGDSVGTGYVRGPRDGLPKDSLTEAAVLPENVTQLVSSASIDDRRRNVLAHANSGDLGGADGDTLGSMSEGDGHQHFQQQRKQQPHQSLPPSRRASFAAEEVATGLVDKLAARGGDAAPPSRERHEDGEKQEDKHNNGHNKGSLVERDGGTTGEFKDESVRESSKLRVDAACALLEGISGSGSDTGSGKGPASSRSTNHDGRNNTSSLKNENPSSRSVGGQRVETTDRDGNVLQQASEAVAATAAAAVGEKTHNQGASRRNVQDEEQQFQEGHHRPHEHDAESPLQEGSVVALDNPENGNQIGVEDRHRHSGGRINGEAGESRETGRDGSRRHPYSLGSNQEDETSDVVRRDTPSSSSNNRELVHSPPMISRRRSSGRMVEPGFDKHSTVDGAGERQDRVSGEPARKQSVHGGGDVKPLRLASSSSAEQQSTSHEPTPNTPRRERPTRATVVAATPKSPAVLPTPRSPMAVAARAVSLEESVRSTLRMKRAADAIALEDAQLRADAERQERRNNPSGNRNSPAARTRPEPERDEQDEQEEVEEARARHAEKIRIRALRAFAAREEAEIERDRALELTLEVLRRKRADKRRGVSRAHSAPGRKRALSPPRKSRRPEDRRTSLARRVKDSAARSRQLGREDDKRKTASDRRTEDLAQPKEERPATRARNPATEGLVAELTRTMTDKEKRAFLHACLEDAKECTHRPNTRSAAARRARGGEGGGADEETKDGGGAATNTDAFLCRMEAQERAKATAMEHRRGELAYKAVLDKRVCPGCGAEQSYDEVQEKRKTCPNCEVEYRRPRTWTGVRKDFLDRVEAFQELKRESLQAAIDYQKRQMRTLALGGRYRAPNADTDSENEMDERERLYWEDIEDDFVSRLREDAARRQAALESRSATMHQDWTFQPTLSAASERVVGDSAWAGMSFLERVEGDLQRRREAAPPPSHAAHESNSGYGFGFGDSSYGFNV